jgi:hypothetical protein
MTTTAFTTATQPSPPDPRKRVNYFTGQILGVDDFTQEQFYFLSHDRLHHRSLHGYGTVAGLAVALAGTEARVAPGLAVTPSGAVVVVDATQCADAGAWVAAHAADLPAGADGLSRAWVVLRHRECASDALPAPAGVCCGDGENLQATRVTETFLLEFAAQPPAAAEHQGTDRLGRLLRALRQAPAVGTPLSPTQAADLARALLTGEAPAGPYVVAAADLEAVLDTLLRVWVTEVRPALMDAGDGPAASPAQDPGIALAELRFQLAGGALVAGSLVLDDSARPVLLSTRALQELYAPGSGGGPQPAAAVVPETAFGLAATVGASEAYARADHSHGSPVLPALGGDASGSLPAVQVTGLRGRAIAVTAPAAGQLLGFDGSQWRPVAPPTGGAGNLDGDVTGPAADNHIANLQGQPVKAEQPAEGQMLAFVDGAWRPMALPDTPSSGPRLVAGGTLEVGGVNAPFFGGLTLVGTNPIQFSFTGYTPPDRRRGYVVKALPVVKPGSNVPDVALGGFEREGIVLSLGVGGRPRGFDNDVAIMVEVTEFVADGAPRALSPAATSPRGRAKGPAATPKTSPRRRVASGGAKK